MNVEKLRPQIEKVIDTQVTQIMEVGGGDINRGYSVETANKKYFLKTPKKNPEKPGIYRSESWGLEKIDNTGAILSPQVAGMDSEGNQFLLLDWMDLTSYGDWARAGEQLRNLHKTEGDQFGFSHRLFIGACSFEPFETKKLGDFYFDGLINPLKRRVLDPTSDSRAFSELFDQFEDIWREKLNALGEQPMLIHGDLWSGNIAFLDSGEPVIFDPASYFGIGEIDIAMTELFGRFPSEFYTSYFGGKEEQRAYESRRSVWQLLPYLVHLYLFGGSYLSAVDRILSKSHSVT